MKILQIAPYFVPYSGGQEKFVYLLSKELVRLGHEVTVVTSNFPKNEPYEILDGVEVFRYKCFGRPLRNPITPGIFFFNKFKKYDIIHAHNEHASTTIASVFYKFFLKKPLVITSHGELVFGSKAADFFRDVYWKIIGKTLLSNATLVTVATPSEKNRLIAQLNLSPSRIELIPVGVDLLTWDSLLNIDNQKLIKKYNLADKKVILVATQMIKRKGLQYLIKAMPEIVQKFSNAVCLIAGEGDYKGQLIKLMEELNIEHRVIFIGLLDTEGLARAYKTADIFVLPSLGEGQPTCVMEAWAFSKPVVTTRITGVVDYYNDVAVLVEPKNSKELTRAIIELLSDPSNSEKLGQAGRELVQSQFTWEKIARRTEEIYNNILAE